MGGEGGNAGEGLEGVGYGIAAQRATVWRGEGDGVYGCEVPLKLLYLRRLSGKVT